MNKNNSIEILVLAFLSLLITVRWTPGGRVSLSEDVIIYNPKNVISLILDSPGQLEPTHFALMPYIFYEFIADILSFDFNSHVRLILFSTLFLWLYSTKLLIARILPSLKRRVHVVLSIYCVSAIWYTSSWLSSAKASQVILTNMLIYIFLGKSNLKQKLNWSFLCIFFNLSVFTNLGAVSAMMVLFLLLFYLFGRHNLKIYLLGFLSPSLRKNFFSFIILLVIVGALYANFLMKSPSLLSQSSFTGATNSSVFKLIQLRGGWWENGGFEFQGKVFEYVPWINNLEHPVIIASRLILFLIPIILVFFLNARIGHQNNQGELQLFTKIVTVTLFMTIVSSGDNLIPGYSAALSNITLLQIFREPWSKFGPYLALSATISLGYCLHVLKKRFQKIDSNKLMNILIFSTLLISAQSLLAQNLQSYGSPLTLNKLKARQIELITNEINASDKKSCIFYSLDQNIVRSQQEAMVIYSRLEIKPNNLNPNGSLNNEICESQGNYIFIDQDLIRKVFF